MTDPEELLPSAFERMAREAPHQPDLALIARQGVRRRRRTRARTGAATLVAASVAVGAIALQRDDDLVMAASGAAATGTCRSKVSTAPLPAWAQKQADAASRRWKGSGQPAGTRPPHVFSAEGDFVAIMAPGRVLRSPSRDGMSDLVQFAARRTPDGEVMLTVRRNGTGPVIPGYSGPLYQPDGKMPLSPQEPGCYRFVFTWDGITRSVDLQWQPGPRWAAADLPRPDLDLVNREGDKAQNKLPGGGYQPPPGRGLSTQYQWVKSTRAAVIRTLGAFDRADSRGGASPSDAAGTPSTDPGQVVYVVQIPYNENDQADILSLHVVVTIGPGGRPETVVTRPGTRWTDLSPLGTPHLDDQSPP